MFEIYAFAEVLQYISFYIVTNAIQWQSFFVSKDIHCSFNAVCHAFYFAAVFCNHTSNYSALLYSHTHKETHTSISMF